MITAHDLDQAQAAITAIERTLRTVPTNWLLSLSQLTDEIEVLRTQIAELEAEKKRCQAWQDAHEALRRLKYNAVLDMIPSATPEVTR